MNFPDTQDTGVQADGFSRVKLETRILGEELQGKQEWKKKYLFKILLWNGIPSQYY